ncbi:MAG: MFS transporter [Acidimicrobiales bacterium]
MGPRAASPRAALPPGFGVLWTTVALDLVGFGIVLPLLPIYAARLHVHPAVIGLLFAAFSLAQLVCAPLWGRLSDRVGRRPVLLVSLVGTALGSLLTGLAGSFALLLVGRVVDGVSGASVSVAQASVADVAGPQERARLFGLLGAAFGVGFVAGPALGALAALVGPRAPFFLAAGLAGINALVALRRLPETHVADRGPTESAPGGQVEPGPHSQRSPSIEATDAPRGWRLGSLGRHGGLRGLLALSFASLVAFSAFETTLPQFGARYLHFREASTGAVFTAVGLVLALVQSSLVGPTVRRLGESGTLRLGLAVNALGLVLLAGVRSWWLLAPALLALVVGQGLVSPSLTATFAARAGRRRGGVLGVQQSVNGLARVVGPVGGGVLFQQLNPSAPYLAGAGVMAACALLVGALWGRGGGLAGVSSDVTVG